MIPRHTRRAPPGRSAAASAYAPMWAGRSDRSIGADLLARVIGALSPRLGDLGRVSAWIARRLETGQSGFPTVPMRSFHLGSACSSPGGHVQAYATMASSSM